ncbi:MAG: hypothetical protein AAF957_16980 [Planctomycetota bacterium]
MNALLLLSLVLAPQVQDAPSEPEPTAAEARAERMRTFADDLAAESGVAVVFEDGGPPHLRIGAPDSPAIVLVPGELDDDEPLQAAFDGDPVRAARSIAIDGELRAVLDGLCVLVPVALEGRGSLVVDPGQNFPARWSRSREIAGRRAGPYPGALPRVSELTDWLLGEARCAGVVLAGVESGAVARGADGLYAPGSLAAFAEERVGASVESCDRTWVGRKAALLRAVNALPRLELRGAHWQRIGASSWTLDLVVANVGPTGTGSVAHARARRPRGVEVQVELRSAGARWASSAVALEDGAPLRVLEARDGVLALPDLDGAHACRLRLFFASEPGTEGAAPVVDVEARSARSVRGVLTGLSP